MPKLFHVRRARLRITRRGIRVTPASVRIGGRNSWVNVSRHGISTTTRVPGGTYNSRRGCSVGLIFVMAGALLAIIVSRL